uniref:3'-5' exonuclease n=1 Tax=Ascaris lumbricoides TaxID=6252 RepID=A0A0M3ITF8_ASCLU
MKAISNAYLDLETSQMPLSMISSVGACIDEISPSKLHFICSLLEYQF